ncbi:hypothetical protein MD484_g4702, partial [Candolleomyces efflorescens]
MPVGAPNMTVHLKTLPGIIGIALKYRVISSASFFPRPPTPFGVEEARRATSYSSLRHADSVLEIDEYAESEEDMDTDDDLTEDEWIPGTQDERPSPFDTDADSDSTDMDSGSTTEVDEEGDSVADSSSDSEEDLIESEDDSESEMSPPPSPDIDPVLFYFKTPNGQRIKGFRGNPDTVIDDSEDQSGSSSTKGVAVASNVKPDGDVKPGANFLDKASREFEDTGSHLSPISS